MEPMALGVMSLAFLSPFPWRKSVWYLSWATSVTTSASFYGGLLLDASNKEVVIGGHFVGLKEVHDQVIAIVSSAGG